jgi:hypothetical protein
MDLSKGFRYQFTMWNEKPFIQDVVDGKQWRLTGKSDDGHPAEDYMLIDRVPHSQTGQFLVIAGGLTQYGTAETGRILASPDVLAPILSRLPTGLQTRNLQLVLHSAVLGDSPAPPNLIASYVW